MSTVTKPIILDETGVRMAEALESIAASTERVKITVTMKDTSNNPATGEQVIVTNIATGAVMATVGYSTTAVEIYLPRDSHVRVTGSQNTVASTSRYYPSKFEGFIQSDTSITITYNLLTAIDSLSAAQAMVQAHPGEESIPVGTTITLPYVCQDGQTRDWPWMVMKYGWWVKEENKDKPDSDPTKKSWGFELWATKTNDVNIQFDAPEQEQATETTAVDGLYYYGKTGNTITDLNLTAGDEIPYGDYDVVYRNSLNDSSKNIIISGYNNWKYSSARQYLNSDGGVDEWWVKSHTGDTKPAQASQIRGMLYGFRAVDKAGLTAVDVHTVGNTVCDGGAEYVTYDKMFLPCKEEVFGVPDAAQLGKEGAAWKWYWTDAEIHTTPMTVASDGNTDARKISAINATWFQSLWVRSAHRGLSNHEWNVSSSGNLNIPYGASYAYRCVPACVIC